VQDHVMDKAPQPTPKTTPRRAMPNLGRDAAMPNLGHDALVAAICGFVVVLMVGAAYAAVPFYNWFCRATGFNGTTQVATSAPSSGPLARKIAVRFDSNVAGGLPWKFEPEKTEIEVRIGEVVTVYYTVTNQSARATAGQAAYNVAPLTVGAYFQKINCFCFTEQTMAPGERREMPVVFYVDRFRPRQRHAEHDHAVLHLLSRPRRAAEAARRRRRGPTQGKPVGLRLAGI
jgi:cytochrome c oxidase assembly protein subunit 11